MKNYLWLLRHYIVTALRASGVRVDSDTYSEIDLAFRELGEAFDNIDNRITELENEIRELRAELEEEQS